MSTLLSLSDDLANAVAQAARSVVAVNARHRMPSTGVHWRPGFVVTAEHTVRIDEEITVTRPDGETVPATLAGRDPSTDLSVLAVKGLTIPLAELAESSSLKVGHLVLALGHGPRVSWGVVSALAGRWRTRRGGEIDQLISVDLVLYPGFSGGPLVTMDGRVVGINTSGLSRQMSLAIPASTVSRVSEELSARGRVARSYLGVGLQPVQFPKPMVHTSGLSSETGVMVVNVQPGGPADLAGLVIGDVLVAVDGTRVGEIDDVQAILGPQRVGSTVHVSIFRAGAPMGIAMTVGERPPARR